MELNLPLSDKEKADNLLHENVVTFPNLLFLRDETLTHGNRDEIRSLNRHGRVITSNNKALEVLGTLESKRAIASSEAPTLPVKGFEKLPLIF